MHFLQKITPKSPSLETMPCSHSTLHCTSTHSLTGVNNACKDQVVFLPRPVQTPSSLQTSRGVNDLENTLDDMTGQVFWFIKWKNSFSFFDRPEIDVQNALPRSHTKQVVQPSHSAPVTLNCGRLGLCGGRVWAVGGSLWPFSAGSSATVKKGSPALWTGSSSVRGFRRPQAADVCHGQVFGAAIRSTTASALIHFRICQRHPARWPVRTTLWLTALSRF